MRYLPAPWAGFIRRTHRFGIFVTLLSGSALAASEPPQMSGVVTGGGRPLANATVLLYQAGLNAGDAPRQIGAGVSNAGGQWNITLGSVPANGQLLYALALGGKTANGPVNPNTALMTVAGLWGAANFPSTLALNERTTVASTAQMQGYIRMLPCNNIQGSTTRGLSGIPLNCPSLAGLPGMARHATTVSNLVNVANGGPADFLLAGPSDGALNRTLQKMNLQANVMAQCIAQGGQACSTYFSLAAALNQFSLGAVAGSPFRLTFTPGSIVLTPDGRNAYTPYPLYLGLGAYRINPASGGLTQNGPALVTASSPFSIALAPNGRVLYASVSDDAGNGQLLPYAIMASGTLSPLPSYSFPAAVKSTHLAVSPNGRYVYVNYLEPINGVRRYAIKIKAFNVAAGGELLPIDAPPVVASSFPNSIKVSPDGQFLYVLSDSNSSITAYAIDNRNGSLKPATPQYLGLQSPGDMAFSPNGQYLYVANSGSNALTVLQRDKVSGTLSAPKNYSLCKETCFPSSVAVSGDGQRVFVTFSYSIKVSKALQGKGFMSVFAVDTKTGLLSPLTSQPQYLAEGSSTVAASTDGRFAYTANYRAKTVSAFSLSAAAGSTLEAALNLALYATPSSAAGLFALAVGSPVYTPVPTAAPADLLIGAGPQAYTFAEANSQASANTMNASTGSLSPVAGSPSTLGFAARSKVMTADGRFIYAWDAATQKIKAFSISPGSGSLSELSTSVAQTGSQFAQLILSPDGQYLFASTVQNLTSLQRYTRSPVTGALSLPASTALSNSGGVGLVFTPDGRFAYCTQGGALKQCSYTAATGALIPADTQITTGLLPLFSPDSRFAYVYDGFDKQLRIFAIDSSTGALSKSAEPMAGIGPNNASFWFMTFSPDSRFAYAISRSGKILLSYARDLSTGALTPIGQPIGSEQTPNALSMSSDGRFLYQSFENSRGVRTSVGLPIRIHRRRAGLCVDRHEGDRPTPRRPARAAPLRSDG